MAFFLKKNKRLIKRLTLLAIPFIFLIAIKGFVWFNTKVLIDQFLLDNQTIANVHYQSIDNSLSGSVSVHNLTLYLPSYKETFHIQSIQLKANNIIDLIQLSNLSDLSNIPNSLQLSVKGIDIELKGDLLSSNKVNPLSLGCGKRSNFDGRFLQDLKYSSLQSDLDIYYQFNPIDKQLSISLNNIVDEIYSLDMSFEINGLKSVSIEQFMAMFMLPNLYSSPKLGHVKLNYQDELFLTKKNIYCANVSHSSVKQYIQTHTQLFVQYLNSLGYSPNQEVISAYQKLQSSSPRLVLEMDFSTISNYITLLQSTPNYYIENLQMGLFLDDEIIKPLDIKYTSKVFNYRPIKKNTHKKITQNKSIVTTKRFHLINIEQLNKYVNYPVHVKARDGRSYKGKLKMDGKYNVEVVTRKKGGEMSFHFVIEDLKEVKVYY